MLDNKMTLEQQEIVKQRNNLLLKPMTIEQEQIVKQRNDLLPTVQPNNTWYIQDKPIAPVSAPKPEPSLFETATQALEPLDPDANLTDEMAHFVQQGRINAAQQALVLAEYKASTMPSKTVSDAELSKAIGGLPITDNETRYLAVQEWTKQAYEEALTPNGALKESVIDDAKFMQVCMTSPAATPDAIKTWKDAYQLEHMAMGETGLFDTVSRAFATSRLESERATELLDTKDFQAYSTATFQDDFKYKRDDDGVIFDTARMVADMVNPLLDNWALSLGSLALTTVTGGLSARLGIGAIIGYDAYKREQASTVAQQVYEQSLAEGKDVTNEFSKADVQAVLDAMRPYNVASAALEVVGDWAIGKLGVAPFMKLLKPSKTKKLVEHTAEQIAENTVQVDNIGKSILKDFGLTVGGTVASEAVTEGVQGAIQRVGLNQFQGKELTQGVKEAALESAQQVIAPAALLSAILGGGHAGAKLMVHAADIHNLHRHMVTSQTDAIAGNTETMATMPEQAAEVYNTQTIYIDMQGASRANAQGFDFTQANSNWSEESIRDASAAGDKLTMTRGEFAKLAKENPELAAFLSRFKTEDPTIDTAEEITQRTNMETLRQTAQLIEQEVDKYQQDNIAQDSIESDIRQGLHSLQGKLSSAQIDDVARMHGAFIRGLSHITGIDMQTVFDIVRPMFAVREDMYDTRQTAGQDVTHGSYDPVTNTIKLTEGADLHTTLHENGHFFLMAIDKIVNNPDAKFQAEHKEAIDKARNFLTSIKQEMGAEDIDLNNVADKRVQKFEEDFVNQFLQYILDEHQETNPLRKVYANFSRWLGSLKQFSLHGYDTGLTAQEALARRYQERFNEVPNPASDGFKQLMDRLFLADKKAAEINEAYAPNGYLNGLDVTKLDPEILKEINALNEEIELRSREAQQSLIEDDLRVLASNRVAKLLERVRKTNEQQIERAKLAEREGDKAISRAEIKRREVFRKKLDEVITKSKAIQNVFNRFVAEEKAKLMQDPLFATVDAIKGQINQADAKANLSPVIYSILNKQGYFAKDGAYSIADLSALKAGFDGVTMCEKIAQAPSIEDMARINAYQRLLETRGKDIAARIEAEEKQSKAYVLDVRKRMNRALCRQLNQLAQNSEQKIDEQQRNNLTALAKYHVRLENYKQLNPRVYIKQAAKAGQMARKALADGDLALAAKMFRTEHYNLERAIEAGRIKRDVDKHIDTITKFAKRTNKSLSDNHNVDIVNILRYGLEKMGLVTSIENYPESRKQVEPLFAEAPELSNLINQVETSPDFKSYRDASAEQIQRALDTLDKLKKTAYSVEHIIVDGHNTKKEVMHVRTAQQEMINSMSKARTSPNAPDFSAEGGRSTNADTHTFRDSVLEFMQSTRAVLTELQKMGGGQLNALVKYLYKPISDAEARFKEAYDHVYEQVRSVWKEFDTNLDKPAIVADELVLRDGQKWVLGARGEFKERSTYELFGILLHMGNKSNRMKLLDGYLKDKYEVTEGMTAHERHLVRLKNLAWKEMQWNKFFNRMIAEGHITKGMMNAVQKVWDIFGSLEGELQTASRQVKGYGFERVKPNKITVKFKDGTTATYNGGYVPSLENKFAQQGQALLDPNGQVLQEYVNQLTPTTFDGFLETRNESSREVCTDPMMILNQLSAELKYIHIMPSVNQAVKLMNNTALARRMDNINPHFRERIFMPWLTDVCNMRNSRATGMQFAANKVRQLVASAGKIIMMGNLPNAIQQFANFTTLANRCSPAEIVNAAVDYILHPLQSRQAMMDESVKMRARLKEHHDGINAMLDELLIDPSLYDGTFNKAMANAKVAGQWINKHSYFAQKFTQDAIDVVAYNASKQNYLKKHKNDPNITPEQLEKDAIAYAEISVVQTQMSFDIADVSAMERGTAWNKLFLQFGGYFFNQMRLAGAEMAIAARRYEYNYAHIGLWMTLGLIQMETAILPAVLGEAVMQGAKGNLTSGNDDDKDAAFEAIKWSIPKFYFAGVPYGGKLLTNIFESTVEGKTYNTGNPMFTSPAYSMLENAWRAGMRVYKKQEIQGKDLKAATYLLCLMASLKPETSWAVGLAPISRGAAYSKDWADDRIEPNSIPDAIRGIITGFTPDSQKNQKK